MRNDFVPMMNVLHLRMNGALGEDFTAQAAGDAEAFDDSNFHGRNYCEPPKARLGSRPAHFV
jgi:hypothetical protein